MKTDQEARQLALQLLSRREYSARELQQKLQADHDPDQIETVLAQLQEQGLQSDARFAEMYVRHRQLQGHGPVRIQGELRQKGIAPDLVQECLQDGGVDWFEQAKAVRRRRFGDTPPLDARLKARQMRFLQYRGFTPDQIRFALADDD